MKLEHNKRLIGEIKGIAIITDKENKPIINNPQLLPIDIWSKFSDFQKNYANSRVSANLRRYD